MQPQVCERGDLPLVDSISWVAWFAGQPICCSLRSDTVDSPQKAFPPATGVPALRRRYRAAAGTCFNQCVLQYFRRRTAEARIRIGAMRGARRRGVGVNNKKGMMKASWGKPVHAIAFIRTLMTG